MMKPGECCKGCDNVKEDSIIRNEFRCIFGCGKLAKEQLKKAYDSIKGDKGCGSCNHCVHVRDYPGFVTGEECDCLAGLECDTVLFSVKNCPRWVGRYEEE